MSALIYISFICGLGLFAALWAAVGFSGLGARCTSCRPVVGWAYWRLGARGSGGNHVAELLRTGSYLSAPESPQ